MPDLARKMGGEKNTSLFMEVLSRDKQFKQATETPIGKELLIDIVDNVKRLAELILSEKDEPETRAELRCYLKIQGDWSKKINDAILNQAKLTEKSRGA